VRVRGAVGIAAMVLVPASAAPFVVLGPVWDGGEAPLHVGALEGSEFRSALVDAARDWEAVSDFDFLADFDGDGACDRDFLGRGELTDGAEFETRDCDGSFLDFDTLAVTQIESVGDRTVAVGAVFNDDLAWDVYDGPWDDDAPDFRRVALHELGHWLGLGHENGALAIMASFAGDTQALQADDVDGVRFLYGPTGPPPPPPPPPVDPEVACRQGQLRAAGSLCRRHFACEGKRARRPEKDPDGLRRDACQEAAESDFVARFDAAANPSCLWTESGSAALPLVAEAAALTETGLLAGADPGNPADAKLRQRLLKRAGRACGEAFGAEARFAKSAGEARRAKQRGAARTAFVAAATGAIARAAEHGVVYGGTAPAAVAGELDALVDAYAGQAAGNL
jgi:Matrixin